MCGKGHEWEAIIYNRSRGTACPYCIGRSVCDDNSLQTVNPALAKEWHPTKNGNLTPNDVLPGSTKKAWWVCKRGHEWFATIRGRSKGKGCPYCYSRTSQLQLRVYCELKYLFPDTKHREKVYGQECDIFIPSLKVAIEVDSLYWHQKKREKDRGKSIVLKERGIDLIRVREEGLERLTDADIVFSSKDHHFTTVRKVMRRLREHKNLIYEANCLLSEHIKRKTAANDAEYRALLDRLPSPLPGLSLREVYPALAKDLAIF